jgi:hypothetical protein
MIFPVVSWAFIAGHSMFCGLMGVSNFLGFISINPDMCYQTPSISVFFFQNPHSKKWIRTGAGAYVMQ